MKKKTTDEFIKDAKKIYGDRYDYSKVEYVNDSTKICIICPIHGEFWKTPSNHIHKTNPQGCIKCSREKLSQNLRNDVKEFVNKANDIHNDKYSYDKIKYINNRIKIIITCPLHGDFYQTPYSHLQGCGCPKCVTNTKLSNEEFIQKAKIVHGDKYDYSLTKYKNALTNVDIICKKHGKFRQTPHSHLSGRGCPFCKSSHMETEIRNYLKTNNIIYEEQKHFEWLGKQTVDFYLPNHNVVIECQGIQHFEPTDFAGKGKMWSNEGLVNCVERDKLKKHLLNEHNIRILYYADYCYDFPYKVYTNKEELLNEILK